MTQSVTNTSYRDKMLIMRAAQGFYPIQASGTRPLAEEAMDHGALNPHIHTIEDIDGNILWRRQ